MKVGGTAGLPAPRLRHSMVLSRIVEGRRGGEIMQVATHAPTLDFVSGEQKAKLHEAEEPRSLA